MKKKKSRTKVQKPWGLFVLSIFLLLIAAVLAFDTNNLILNKVFRIKKSNYIAENISLPTQTITPTPTTAIQTHNVYANQNLQNTQNSDNNNSGWGVAKQISEHTWTIKIADDNRMATPKEILDALNDYRQKHGSGYIAWDDNLGIFAQNRADYFNKRGSIDEHAGFTSYLNSSDNHFGFHYMGENSSIGYRVLGVHLIEWIYAADAAHNANQLDPKWTHVGIGVSGTATDLVFGQ